MTGEATTLVSGKTYQVTAAARRLLDFNTPLVVKDNAVDHTADVISVDYLNGTVTFASAYTVVGPVTIDGKYVPTVVIAGGRTTSLTQTAAEIDLTTYETAQANDGWRIFKQGLKTVQMEVGGVFAEANQHIQKLATRGMIVVDVSPDNSTDTIFRGFFKRTQHSQQGEVGALEENTLNLTLFVPSGDLLERAFSWYFTGSTKLPIAVRKVLAAWQTGVPLKIQYLPDGTTGISGDAIVTECSMSNSFENQNEFSLSFRGSGPQVAVP